MAVERPFPWFSEYPDTLLADTGGMTAAAVGAYARLKAHYWRKGGKLPTDTDTLSKLAGVDGSDLEAARGLFYQDGDILRHEALDRDLERARRSRNQHSEAGKKSGLARSKESILESGNSNPEESPHPTDTLPLPLERSTTVEQPLNVRSGGEGVQNGLIQRLLNGGGLSDQELESIETASRAVLPPLRVIGGAHYVA